MKLKTKYQLLLFTAVISVPMLLLAVSVLMSVIYDSMFKPMNHGMPFHRSFAYPAMIDPRELLLRMRNMLEHHYGTFTQIKHLYIDAVTKKVFNESLHDEVLFTAIERKIFFYLYENRDSILTKEHFFEYLWQLEDRNPNIVNVHIKKIRAKINDRSNI